MGNGFAETSVNKIDPKKYEENFNKIDWGKAKMKDIFDEIMDMYQDFKQAGKETKTLELTVDQAERFIAKLNETERHWARGTGLHSVLSLDDLGDVYFVGLRFKLAE